MNDYRNKTLAALQYIQRDASEAAKFAQDLGNYQAECKYLDQVNDASTEIYRRREAGLCMVPAARLAA
jgi:hypothetical protein